MTTEGPSQSGCLWDDETVDLSGPLDFTVKMYFGTLDAGGADGICLVFAGAPDCGMYGADIGAGGIANSVIFEFDTWDNGGGYGDLPEDHISMDINGVMSTPLFGPVGLGNIEDDMTHTVRFVWDGAGGFQIFFDGALVLAGNYDFASVIGSTDAFLGFTASTGGAWNNQIVCPEDDPVEPPADPEFSEADLSVCAGEQGVVYAVDPVPNATYTWTAPPGATVNGTGASVTIDWGDTGGDVCVVLDNGCGMSDPVCVTVEVTPIPDVQVEDPGILCGMEYDLNALNLFNVEPGQTISFHPDQGAAILGTPDLGNPPLVHHSGTYWIRVEAGDGCIQVVPIKIELQWLDLFVVQPPAVCAPGTVDLAQVDVVDLNGNLLVTFSYYASEQDAIDGIFPLPGSTVDASGSYWVRAETSEGCFGVAQILVVIRDAPEIQVDPPPIQCASASFDLGALAVSELHGWPPGAYTLSYHSSAQAAVTGMPAIDPPVVSQAGTYWVRATTPEGCFDTASVQLVFLPTPSVILSGGDTLCEGDPAILSFAFGGWPPFTVHYTNGTDTFSLSGAGTPLTAMHNPTGDVTYSVLSFTDNTPPGCPPVVSGSAMFHVVPSLKLTGLTKVCDLMTYTVSFAIEGGDSTSWKVQGLPGVILADTFHSMPIPSGQPFNLLVTDSTGCDSLVIAGIQSCDCVTDAGTLFETSADICHSDTLVLNFSGNGSLEPDDGRQFVLHQGSGFTLEGILAWNDQPVFVFDPATMMTGTTYYVSVVAGNLVGGQVDSTDVCFSVTPGIPVVFHADPVLSFGPADTVCALAAYDIALSLSGAPDWYLIYQIDSGLPQQGVFSTTSPQLSIPAWMSTQVTFLTLADEYCSVDLSDTFHLVIHQPPSVTGVQIDCDPVGATYVVSFQVMGGDPATTVVNGLPGIWAGQGYTSLPLTSGATYGFTVNDGFGCPVIPVTGTYDCSCATDAGEWIGGPVVVCATDSFQPILTGMNLDPNDTLAYWLVTDPKDPGNSVVWTWSDPLITWPGPPVLPDSTYFLFSVAGDPGPVQGVDPADPCLDFSLPIPIIFASVPKIQEIQAFPGSQLTCVDSLVTLEATVDPAGSPLLNWTTSGGSLPGQVTLPELEVRTPGWYTLHAVHPLAGCADSAGVYVGLDNSPPKADAGGSILVPCGQAIPFLDGSGSMANGQIRYRWSALSGVLTGDTSLAMVLPSGSGVFVLEVTDLGNGCMDADTVNLQLLPGITGAQIGADPPLCFDDPDGSIAITGVQGGSGAMVVQVDSQTVPVPGVVSGLGGGDHLVHIADGFGCAWDTVLSWPDLQPLGVDLGPDVLLTSGESWTVVPVFSGSGAGITDLQWFVLDTLACTGCPSLLLAPLGTTPVRLAVEDVNGCLVEDEMVIRVQIRRQVFIPDAFSPDDDGINDLFTVYGSDQVDRVLSMGIYDRWGNDVFLLEDFSADGTHGWNGRFRDRKMDPGVYIYVIDLSFKDGARRLYKGDVHLVR